LAGLALLMEDEPFRRALGQRGAIGVKDRYAMQRVLRLWDAVFDTCHGFKTDEIPAERL
jgi:hypothetical protein